MNQKDFIFDVGLVNESHIEMLIKPAMNRDQEDDFDNKTIEFDWELKSNHKGLLDFDVNFKEPYYISPLIQE